MSRQSATGRLVRLLALLTWVADHDGVTVQEAASHFQVSPATIRRDVETLWLSGLPGGMPDDLVDFDATAWEAGRLRLTDSQGLDHPVRLTPQETVSLLLSLRVLEDLLASDPHAGAVITRTRQALAGALGADPHAAGAVASAPAGPGGPDPAVLAAVRQAMDGGRRLHLAYVSATDRRTERDVDPLELVSNGSHLTLRAWCLDSGAERSFRLDRVLAARVLGERSRSHRLRRRPAGARPTATLHLRPTGRWLTEQVPTLRTTTNPDGTITAVVEGRDEEWLVGLVLSAGRHLLDVQPLDLAHVTVRRARAALAADQAVYQDLAPTPVVEQDVGRDEAGPRGR